MWYKYAMKYLLFIHKKNGMLPFATTWIKLEDIVLSEIRLAHKDGYPII
jgi:hypothetical protein